MDVLRLPLRTEAPEKLQDPSTRLQLIDVKVEVKKVLAAAVHDQLKEPEPELWLFERFRLCVLSLIRGQ